MRIAGIGIILALVGAVVVAAQHGSPIAVGQTEHGDLWSTLFLCTTAVAFVLYVVALVSLREAGSLRFVCAVAIAVQLVPLAGPLLLSRDTFSYWAYGRIVTRHDANPYSQTPAHYPSDPATRDTAAAWRGAASDYGPAFTAGSSEVAALAGRSGETATLLFRTAAAIAVLLTTALAIRLARRKAFAAAFISWNPLLAIQFAGGGHNDALMVAALLAALLLLERRSDAAGGALWIAAAAIKIVALPLLALSLARARRAMFAGAITTAVGIALASTLVFGAAWLSSLGSIANRHAAASIPAQLAAAGLGKPVAFGLADVALLAGTAWLTFEALRGRRRLALGACILLVTTPWLLPWYAIWPTALAAVEEDALAQIVALSLSAYLLPDRVPV